MKAMTLRLTNEQAAELEGCARITGESATDILRTALSEYIHRRRRDPAFQERLRVIVDRDRDLLERLAQ